MFESIAAILFFGFSTDPNQAPISNRVLEMSNKKTCITVAKDLSRKFEAQYPEGIFIAECKDEEYRTYFRIQNNRTFPTTKTEIV